MAVCLWTLCSSLGWCSTGRTKQLISAAKNLLFCRPDGAALTSHARDLYLVQNETIERFHTTSYLMLMSSNKC